MDFGAGTWCIPRSDEKLTGTAEVVGTPKYMSPEQTTNPDPFAEITCYKMRAETLLFDGQLDLSLTYFNKAISKIEHWIGSKDNSEPQITTLRGLVETQLGMSELYLTSLDNGKATEMLNRCASELAPYEKSYEVELYDVKRHLVRLDKRLQAQRTHVVRTVNSP